MDDETLRSGNLGKSKNRRWDAIIVTAVNMAAMGAGIAAAVVAANKSRSAKADADRIEKCINQLSVKFDQMSEQLKNIKAPQQGQQQQQQKKTESSEGAAGSNTADKKHEGKTEQPKPQQGVIYVRKSSDFSFYN